MYAPYVPEFAYLAETIPANVAGGAIALINAGQQLGSVVGAYGGGGSKTSPGSPGMSYLLMAAALDRLCAPHNARCESANVTLRFDFGRCAGQGQSMKMADCAVTGFRSMAPS